MRVGPAPAPPAPLIAVLLRDINITSKTERHESLCETRSSEHRGQELQRRRGSRAPCHPPQPLGRAQGSGQGLPDPPPRAPAPHQRCFQGSPAPRATRGADPLADGLCAGSHSSRDDFFFPFKRTAGFLSPEPHSSF